uniref:Coiled-coil domain containing 78 n=1 Tax=Malurus cyaneus samueli TaxID=2593467 RepID=A0A8C5UH98_9PASS
MATAAGTFLSFQSDFLPKAGCVGSVGNHRISEWFGLEGTLKLIPSHPCHGQGHLPLSQGAPSHILPGLVHFQGSGSRSFGALNKPSFFLSRLALGKELQEAKGAIGDTRNRLAEQSAVRTGCLAPPWAPRAPSERAGLGSSAPAPVPLQGTRHAQVLSVHFPLHVVEARLAKAVGGILFAGFQKELVESLGIGTAGFCLLCQVLLTSQNQLQEVEAENARLQLRLKELNEEYRARLARYIGDVAVGAMSAPASQAAMKLFVDRMLRDIRASYKSREEQLARAARSYRKPPCSPWAEWKSPRGWCCVPWGTSLFPFGHQRWGSGWDGDELWVSPGGAGCGSDPNDPNELSCARQLDEQGWAELRKQLREFTHNTQEELEQQRSQLLARAVVAEEQVSELQEYIDQHLARYKQEILQLRSAEGSEVPHAPGASTGHQP